MQFREGSGPKHYEMVGRGMSACYVIRVTFLAMSTDQNFFDALGTGV